MLRQMRTGEGYGTLTASAETLRVDGPDAVQSAVRGTNAIPRVGPPPTAAAAESSLSSDVRSAFGFFLPPFEHRPQAVGIM